MLNCRIWGGGELIFSGPADGVYIPSVCGQLGILPGHAPLTTTTHPGIVGVFYEKKCVHVEITSGVCLIDDDLVHLWVSHASILETVEETMINWIPNGTVRPSH